MTVESWGGGVAALAEPGDTAGRGCYSVSMQVMARVFQSKREELAVTIFGVVILLIIASSFMYFAERAAQPEVFSSTPATMSWGVVTLTTVGYGDVYPVTSLSKTLAVVIAFLGIGIFALPTGTLGGGFVEDVQRRREGPPVCPHCGRET